MLTGSDSCLGGAPY